MRCLVLSDIHSNLTAFQAVLSDASPFDQVWCLGDVVGYGPDPNDCVELLRSLPHVCIAGNHDWGTLGLLDLRDFNHEARIANEWNRKQLSRENLAYLESLPETVVDGDFTLAHGSPCHPFIWEYILYASTAMAGFGCFDTAHCFVGHTHTPVVFELYQEEDQAFCEPRLPPEGPLKLGTQRLIINPGSVGQPRDGDRRASYIILDRDAMTVEHRRVAYDFAKTQAAMERYGLPERQVARLAYGW